MDHWQWLHGSLAMWPEHYSVWSAVASRRGLCRIKILPVVGHVHELGETLRVRTATANVALTLMKYTLAYII